MCVYMYCITIEPLLNFQKYDAIKTDQMFLYVTIAAYEKYNLTLYS